jgi:predicted SnoaL-like aldol condensation-catalyzing enzyme
VKKTISSLVLAVSFVLPSGLFADEQANKELVTKAYQGLFGDHDASVLDKYFKKDYIQHNPMAQTGVEGLRGFFYGFGLDKAPKTQVKFLRTAAEGDMVWLYSIANFGQGDNAVVDIFRIEDGKIAEHWDVMQSIPAKTASGNSMTGDRK